jgi:nicotinamide-nucleotide amidase
VNVEIVTIGDELLLGFTVDTNAAFLARALAAMGVTVIRHSTCGDERDIIVHTVREALNRTGAVITTGGLGPTADDLTTASIAAVFGRDLVRNEEVVRRIEERWQRFKRPGPIPESNYVQAMVPAGADILFNTEGTAPGVWVEDARGRWVATLPGVPPEMRAMFTSSIAPRIAARQQGTPTVVRSLTVRTTGLAESAAADRLRDVAGELGGLSLAYLPGIEGLDLRLTSRGLPADQADAALARAARIVRERLGDFVYAEGDTPLAAVVLDQCRASQLRIAVAESCTGGLLGARITDVPGSSDIFHGGLIAYDNRVKRQLLGVLDSDLVEHGAVSEPVARQMAKGIRVRLGTEIGIAITGIAGPDGGTPEKPVGTVWIALDIAEGRPPIPRPDGHPPLEPLTRARVFQLIGDREEIRERAAQAALEMIRRTVAEMHHLSVS